MSTDGVCTKWHRNITENFNRLSNVHERYRRQTDRRTDGRAITYEFTFAKKTRNTLVNTKRPLSAPEGHFVLYAGLSSNSGVLVLIHCINTFPYYHSTACHSYTVPSSVTVCDVICSQQTRP